MEQKLRAAFPGRSFEVINAGVPGYTSAESMINYQLRVSRLKPDLVIIYHGYNDLKPNRYGAARGVKFKPDYSHFRSANIEKEPGAFECFCRLSFVLSKMHRWGQIRGKKLRVKRLAQTDEGKFDSVIPEGVEVFRENIRRIAMSAKGDGAEILIGTFVTLIDPKKKDLESQRALARKTLPFMSDLSLKGIMDGLDKHNNALREMAKKQNIILADHAIHFPKDPKLFLLEDDIHFSDLGNQKLAELWLKAIQENKLVE